MTHRREILLVSLSLSEEAMRFLNNLCSVRLTSTDGEVYTDVTPTGPCKYIDRFSGLSWIVA